MSVLGIDDFLMSLSGLTDALHEDTHYNLIKFNVNVSNLTSDQKPYIHMYPYSPQLLHVYGARLLRLLTGGDQELHLVPRSKFTGVAAPREGIHVEKHTPRTPFTLVANKPILENKTL